MVNENIKIEGHKKRILTRKAKGWWQSPDAKENMRKAQLSLNEEMKRKKIEGLRNSDYCKLTGFRQLMRKADKIKIPKMNKCKYCGQFFKYKHKTNVFCSKECLNKGKKHAYGYKRPNSTGPNNPAWNGGTNKQKYKRFKRNGKTVYEHIENCLKKYGLESLPVGYCVHHIDRDKSNNAPENLELMKIDDHNKLHGELLRT